MTYVIVHTIAIDGNLIRCVLASVEHRDQATETAMLIHGAVIDKGARKLWRSDVGSWEPLSRLPVARLHDPTGLLEGVLADAQ